MEKYPLVTVYTCVYNGARTISRVFESLQELDYPNVEHVIVNDGSVDDTEKLIEQYLITAKFPVKYYKKEHGGKHTALNAAWNIAEGEFLIQLDADDRLYPHAIKYLLNVYYQIPEEIRSQYWCVHGRCVTQYGNFVGDKYPTDINSLHWEEAGKIASKCKGDKCGLQVRQYLNKYRFPEIIGPSHLPEGIIWTQIDKEYGTWYTNEVVLVYYVNEGGNLTAKRDARKQYAPTCYSYKWKIMNPQLYPKSVVYMIKYSLFFYVADEDYRKNNAYFKDLERYKLVLSLLRLITRPGAIVFRWLKRLH